MNAQATFAAALETIAPEKFNVSNMSHKIKDRSACIAACVYQVFSDTVAESGLTNREKRTIYDAVNPTIEGETCADDRKTIPVISDAYLYLTANQVAAIQKIVTASI